MEKLIERLNEFSIEEDKDIVLNEIKSIFDTKLKNVKYDKQNSYCGSEGHFIESIFNISSNSNNEPDYKGFEIKKHANKISFGDWSASSYIFNQSNNLKKFNNIPNIITKDCFIKLFGNYNIDKKRYAWSGKCIPKYNEWNYNGTMMIFDAQNNLYIIYNYKKDTRNILIPKLFQNQEYYILAFWESINLKKKIENKFNKKGFIIFKKNKNKQYDKMLIGKPITFDIFVDLFKNKKIIFDSGMYQGNSRNYSQFRASSTIWQSLIIEEYH